MEYTQTAEPLNTELEQKQYSSGKREAAFTLSLILKHESSTKRVL